MRDTWKRDFTVFMASQTISLLGSSLVQYAIMWFITLQTKSGVMMTLSIICGFIPALLLSPFAGVWADRYDRKKLIVIADGMIAFVTLAAALVFLAGNKSILLLLAALAFRAVGSAVQGPAVGAILPQIVPEEKLMRANGINGTIQSAIMLVSPMLSGALLTLTSITLIFFIDVATAILAIAVLVFLLRVAPHPRAMQKQVTGYVSDMRLGLRYIREHRYLLSFFAYLGVFLFLVSPAAFLAPLQVTRSFGAQVWRLTAIEVVFSVGMLIGGGLISAWGGFKNRMRTMAAANLVMASCTIALGLAPVFWLYLIFMAIFGVALPLFNTPSSVIIQERVDQAYMGRVYSVLTMLSTSLMPLGMLLFGPLADALRIEWILLASGAIMLFLGLRVLGNKRLMEAGIRAGS